MIEAGDPRAPALLLLHGFPLDPSEWRDLIPVFAERFHVIAPDLFTPEWDVPGEDASHLVVSRESAVRGLLTELEVERFAVVGRGLGGAVALRLAAAGSGVGAAVLDRLRGSRRRAVPAGIELRAQAEAMDAGLPLPTELFDSALAIGGGETTIDVPAPERFLAAGGTDEFLRQIDAMDIAGSLDDLKVEVPVLMLWGEQGRYVPWSLGERLNEAWPLRPGTSPRVRAFPDPGSRPYDRTDASMSTSERHIFTRRTGTKTRVPSCFSWGSRRRGRIPERMLPPMNKTIGSMWMTRRMNEPSAHIPYGHQS